jgi:hypothetical protein
MITTRAAGHGGLREVKQAGWRWAERGGEKAESRVCQQGMETKLGRQGIEPKGA